MRPERKIQANPNTGFAWLRTIGALVIVVDHCIPLLGVQGVAFFPPSWFVTPGYVTLMAFFAMSGFQVQDSWLRDPSWWRYSARRLLRIVPPLVVALLITTLVIGPLITSWPAHAYFAHVQTWRYLVGTTVLFLMQHQLPGVFLGNPYPYAVNGSLWTLPMEVLAYGLVLAAGLVISFGAPRFVLFVLLGGLVWGDTVLGATEAYQGGGGSLLVVPIGSLVAFLVPFVIGMILRTYRDKIPLRPWVAVVLVVAWILATETAASRYLLAAMASYGAITLASHWPSRWARGRTLLSGSYGIYLWGFLITQLLVMAGVRQLWLLIALVVPAAFLAGQLSWRLVEEPTQRLRRYLRKPPPPEPRSEAEQAVVATLSR
ncbi:acyltransferase [Amycolatopsis cynarae]|uniref:Acyltransferase n=1 Tax=Amycolatopsis cynarae TaxID=2995223 RepID=A0ABY7AZY7_9PSEU|nr:acyltransferase [Amycolatopsis sp. HUAS 11-8]WAL65511.1 acyltransferase [Amycolatopsis sp. HUAS 11-8]